jgi:hypothetical protein
MKNSVIKVKVKQRMNKLASNDYDNIMDWQIVEAFNKGMVGWCRRQIQGTNLTKTGNESSNRRIDDIQVLLTTLSMQFGKKDGYYASNSFPKDYFQWKRISAKMKADCCEPRPAMIYLAEEGNVDELLRDVNKNPNFQWAETFCTMGGNVIKIYTNNKFDVQDIVLTYFKQPRRIQILGTVDPYTTQPSLEEVECEFKDDVIELLIDECVKIITGDIESITANQIAEQSVEQNN